MSTMQETKPPVAHKNPTKTEIHGAVLSDDYAWLRQKSDPSVAEYLHAENAYTESVMAPTKPLQEKLYKELLSHIKETDEGVPYLQDDWWYYTRTEEGKQYPIFCRKKSLDAAETVILDVNELAVGQAFMSVGTFTVSDDGSYLAYSTDNTGFRQYTLHFKALRTGELLPERIEKTGSVAWANDNKTLFYSVEDDAKRHYRIYRHTLREDSGSDALVFEEKDEAFNVGVGKSRSGRFLYLDTGSHTTSESWFMDAHTPAAEFKLIAARAHEQEYFAEDRGDQFYIRTNHGGRNFSLVTAPITSPARENWKTLIAHRDDVMIEGHEMFAGFMALQERENGLPHLRVIQFDGEKSAAGAERFAENDRRIAFPEEVYMASPGPNREWNATTYRYHYQSPITPGSVFDYEIATGRSKLLKQTEVPGGFSRDDYRVDRVWATADDGVKVPVSVIYHRSVKRDSTAPLYLYGYGSYGISLPLSFSSNRLALLDRGVVCALAHIRGGGDLGKPWHDAGRMKNKMNTFTDFIRCAEHLIAQKYCDSKRIVIEGGSAGGLLMGAVANMRPEMWRAVISKVPFVDVLNTMLDSSLPLTVGEYEEWGNPNEAEDFARMKQYSPYDNLRASAYPAMLVKTAFNDSQVMYWEPAKYIAKLRTLKPGSDKNVLLLHTNMAAGHGGASGRYDYLKEVAFDYAFLLTQAGIAN
jgi:oligopeptidase B